MLHLESMSPHQARSFLLPTGSTLPLLPSLGPELLGSVTQTTVALVAISSHTKDFLKTSKKK